MDENTPDEMTAALLKYLDLLAGPAMDRFTWDLDFRAAVQGGMAGDLGNRAAPTGFSTRDQLAGVVNRAAVVADEMARVRAERRRAGK